MNNDIYPVPEEAKRVWRIYPEEDIHSKLYRDGVAAHLLALHALEKLGIKEIES